MLDLHKDSQKAFFIMYMDVTVTFYMLFGKAGGGLEAQLVTSTSQFLKPILIRLGEVYRLTDYFLK